jgi:hypothetical protein
VTSLRDHLRRFWFRFEGDASSLPAGTALGCGVTAVNRPDAEQLVRSEVFGGEPLPPFVEVVEDVDVRGLDEGHVVPNMGDLSVRGVWFPRL